LQNRPAPKQKMSVGEGRPQAGGPKRQTSVGPAGPRSETPRVVEGEGGGGSAWADHWPEARGG
ncbi:MAG: hypothetical protein NZ769_11730, partial [Anaerolineae bacterium]|nr:hypothetical protein [Anaerolineae bacterium]